MALAKDLGIASRVQFLGILDDIPAFWRECDVAAVPSGMFVESFSMVTLEAMTCGKPVIASRNGAIPELLIDGDTGTLVTPGSVTELVEAITIYANDPDLRRKHKERPPVREPFRCFISITVHIKYVKIFDELHRAIKGC